jgi:hypothetical protein
MTYGYICGHESEFVDNDVNNVSHLLIRDVSQAVVLNWNIDLLANIERPLTYWQPRYIVHGRRAASFVWPNVIETPARFGSGTLGGHRVC